jgi:hypothetical protein
MIRFSWLDRRARTTLSQGMGALRRQAGMVAGADDLTCPVRAGTDA